MTGLLRRRGISDRGLCGLLGVPLNAKQVRRVDEWRSGLRVPPYRVARIIERKLDVEPGSLWPMNERNAA